VLKKLLKDIITYAPSQFLPAITAFITTPILTRLLPPAEYGNWALAVSTSSLLVALTVSGLGSAIVRYYPFYEANSTLEILFATLGVFSIVVIALVTGISAGFTFITKGLISGELISLLPLIIMIFIAQSFFTLFVSVLRAQGRSAAYSMFQLLMNYSGLGIGLYFVIAVGWGVKGLLWGSLFSFLFILPFMLFQTTQGIGIHFQRFQIKDASELWNYAWPLTLGNVALWGLRVSDLFILNMFRTEREVGLYSVSYNISSKSIELLVLLFLLSVSPMVYSAWEKNGQEATEYAIKTSTRVYLILCVPATIGMSVLAFPFVSILTAPEYYEGYKIVGFVVLSSFLWGLAQIANLGLTIKKQALRLGVNQVLAALTHIALQLLFVPRFGYIVSAISTLIGYTVLVVLNTLSSRPHLRWRFPFNTLRNTVIASLLMGLFSQVIYTFFEMNGLILALFLSILVSIPVYFIALWFLGEISKEEKKSFLGFWTKIWIKTDEIENQR